MSCLFDEFLLFISASWYFRFDYCGSGSSYAELLKASCLIDGPNCSIHATRRATLHHARRDMEQTYHAFSRFELERVTPSIISPRVIEDRVLFTREHPLVMNAQRAVVKGTVHGEFT